MTIGQLEPLFGRWRGPGEGEFPTIAAFAYREEITFSFDADRGLVTLASRAWKRRGDAPEEPSHHEVGVIALEGPELQMSTVHNGSRYERMRGALRRDGDLIEIQWSSVAYANDPRVESSERRWWIHGRQFRYEMFMKTTAVEAPALHLRATLELV